MHWFLGFPCLEALLTGFGGIRVESGGTLVEAEGNLVCGRFWTGEGVLGEGEEEEEGLRKMGELHGCFGDRI